MKLPSWTAGVLIGLLVVSMVPTSYAESVTDSGYVFVGAVMVDTRLTNELAAADSGERLYAVVGFSEPPTGQNVADLEALGLTVVPLKRLPFAAVGGTKDAIWAATAVAGVRSLHANRPLYPLGHTARPDPAVMSRDTNAFGTGVSSVLADRAWSLGITGQGIGVAVLDTGIDTTNPSLALSPFGPVIQNVQTLGDELLLFPQHNVEVFVEDQVTTDTFGHGTHVAGSVAGSGRASFGFFPGVAPGAHLIGLDGLECTIISELPDTGCLVTILTSFDYILLNQDKYHIRVNTNSWGSFPPTPFDPNDPISRAVDELVENDITVLFAAGNSGPGANTMTPESRNPKVVAVAASQPSGGLVRFSSRGVVGGETPTIASPGHLIISTRIHSGGEMDIFTVAGFDAIIPPEFIPNYLVAQGTSMATPVAAGVVALILSANPTLKPTQVKDLLMHTATPMLGYAPHEVGAGFVNAEAAVRNALGTMAKATRVKLPAHMEIAKDASAGEVLLTHDYRASIAGVGVVGFRHFPFSFPVYTNESRPIDIRLQWETIQRYAVYATGYRVRVFDPNFNLLHQEDTDFFSLSQGVSFTIPAETRASRTPGDGAYWSFDMVNFNPGWGILDTSVTVHYGEDFKPPFKTEKIKPEKVHGKPDKKAAKPGGGAEAQGFVQDSNGTGADGAVVGVELVDPLGGVVWRGTATAVDGHFTTFVPVPAGALGSYRLRMASGDAVAWAALAIDGTAPVLSGLSVATDGRSIAIRLSAIDDGGIGYAAVFLTHLTTGETAGVFLANRGDGTYAGNLVLDPAAPTGGWNVEVYVADIASNGASVTATVEVA